LLMNDLDRANRLNVNLGGSLLEWLNDGAPFFVQ